MSAIDRTYDEKRDFIRMQINSPITITHQGKQYAGICKDLSGTGLRVAADEALAIGAECEVIIAQQEEGRRPFNAMVKVARVDAGENDQLLIGFTITEVLA